MNGIFNINDQSGRETFSAQFDRIARIILNDYQMVTPKNSYRIREIEFYYHSRNHPDCYCHKNDRQRINSNFYFHRFKDPEKYINLKQKGLDITFGNNDHKFGGILIRCIENAVSGEIFTGISRIVNLLIEEIGGPGKIYEINKIDKAALSKSSILRLEKAQLNQHRIYKKSRQGLNYKEEDKDKFFINAHYNYFTYPQITQLK